MRHFVQVKLHRDFVEVKGDTIVVGVKAKPVGGKANAEVVKKIAGYFNVPVSRVTIISGHTSRRKVVEIT